MPATSGASPRTITRTITRVVSVAGGVLAVATTALVGVGAGAAHAATTPADGVAVGVAGNHLVDAAGHPLRLVGVDRSGTEYACVQGWGFADGPTDAASVAAIAAWHVNAVRVPLNEDCWLGVNGVSPTWSGAAYRSFIAGYVHELNQAGITAVLDLHWGAPGAAVATGQEAMPDASHAPAFWTSVAGVFRSTPGVVFDLFNEPHDVSWSCWLSGCTMPGGWQAAGMQSLLDAVRATGATQPVMVEGLNWGGDLSGWAANAPLDPGHALVASVHLYNFSGCNTAACWDATVAPVAASVPVVTGEVGETDCSSGFTDTYTAWADAHGISYLAWAWDAGGGWSCSNGPGILQDYAGTPNSDGVGYRDHLAALAAVRTSYALTQSWGNGGIGDLTVTNTGTEPVGTTADPWTIRFALPATASVTDMWNATLSADTDGVVTATAPSYTPVLAPGQSITIGYVLAGTLSPPAEVDVDGAAAR
ncbi:cellulase family glycosylhydrolase [Acidiferrimicrobium sp. IK]|uniref:cellulase family glycosylhydrolase n=1 Tax=Acidiferrimicrobium sp. IK TaxID=2871700 RepID=UPI0021CAE9A7|nr:cellulase family glycosylhydrolase [Acidiferrimicrobium sp. IK]MCU4182957.1 cellulase family glycosylhydrolase [Acidiferrimicrobium sp. IK]